MPFRGEWPDEPEQTDPEKRWGDPERDLPRTPEIPSPPDPSTNDVPKEVATAFWSVVALVNIGLFAVCLGPMLIYFRGQWTLGGGLVVFGLLTLLHAYRRYVAFKNRDEDAQSSTADD